VAQRNRKLRRNSIIFQILCTVEATEMLHLSRYLQDEHEVATVTILHDALLVSGNSSKVQDAMEKYDKKDASRFQRRVSFDCKTV
jgi:hypothetical protein